MIPGVDARARALYQPGEQCLRLVPLSEPQQPSGDFGTQEVPVLPICSHDADGVHARRANAIESRTRPA